MRRCTTLFPASLSLVLIAAAVAADPNPLPPLDAAAAAKISFRRDVMPILRRHCTSCHTKNDPQGDLNMDTVAAFLKGGKTGAAFKAGKPDDSLAIHMVTGARSRSCRTSSRRCRQPRFRRCAGGSWAGPRTTRSRILPRRRWSFPRSTASHPP